MKRILLPVALSLLVASVPARADVVFNEDFNYIDGLSYVVGTNALGQTNWFAHSGSGDSFIVSKKLTLSMSGSADVNRPYYTGGSGGFTNSLTNIFASFTVICTNQPNGFSNYFAHFQSSSSTFQGKVWNGPGSLPGTWKLGVTTTTSTVGLIRWFPVDLATNIPYQVVINWDETQGVNSISTLWVNPLASTDSPVVASDAAAGAISTAFGFRQPSASGTGRFLITNLVVATTFDEAATNVWATNALAPVMVYSPKSGTNFLGTPLPVTLTGVANGQGLGSFTYLWLKDGAIYPGNANTLVTSSAAESDSGAYQLVATTPYGLSVTSAVANLWVTNALIAPIVITQPSNTTVYFGQTANLYVNVFGPGTITYQWNHFGTNLPGETSPVLTIPNVQTNNGTTGGYTVGITNEYGGVLSSSAVLSAVPVPTSSIAFLRTLVDANYLATNSTAIWQATGTVSTFTNLTTGNTSSYYLQDSTAGINIFATLASSFRPAQGDVVTFVGVLSSFNSTLELLADTANNPIASYTILSNNIAGLPIPKVVPFNITNNLAQAEALEGSIVMLTNVFFGANAGSTISTVANTTVVVTNASGETFNVFFSFQDLDTAGQVLPSTAVSILGPLTQNLGNTVTPRNQGYSVTVTRFSDIVTNALTASIAHSAGSSSLTWEAAPVTYPYTVWSATDVTGPYTALTNKLRFADPNGAYTDSNAGGVRKFYRLSTP